MLFFSFTAKDLVYGTEFWRQCLHHVKEILVTIYEVQNFKIAIAAARFFASIHNLPWAITIKTQL